MVSYKDIEKAIEKRAPLDSQESWDNSGWQIRLKTDFSKIMLALEIRSDVIAEAEDKGCDLIISHHPLIFGSLNRIISKDAVHIDGEDIGELGDEDLVTENQTAELIKSGISVYSIHTPMDKSDEGINMMLGVMLEFDTFNQDPYDDQGYTWVGTYDKPIDLDKFLTIAEENLGTDRRLFRFSGDPDIKISKVSWVSGAGHEFMTSALRNDCDLFVTSDVKYHEAQKARELGINIIDMGHYATENRTFIRAISNAISEEDIEEKAEVILSQTCIEPFSVLK